MIIDFLINLIKVLYTLLLSIIFMIWPNKKETDFADYEGDEINECYWSDDSDDDQYTRSDSVITSQPDTTVKTTVFEADKYKVKGGIIEIYPSVTCSTIPEFTYEKIQSNDNMVVYRDNDVVGIMYTIKVKSITLAICPEKVAAIKEQIEGCQLYPINPNVYSGSKINSNYVLPTYIKAKGKCVIYTRLNRSDQKIANESTIIKIINAPVMLPNKKPRIATVGVILAVPNDEDCIWLGSIVAYKNSLFIVCETCKYHAPVTTKLVCATIGCMPYKFIIVENE